MYRRPLPSTNLGFLTAIMWDGREASLAQQAIDATLIHAQATAAPTADQQKQIVDFETGIFTAQIFDDEAGSLHARGATAGPMALSLQLSKFFLGVNDPVGLNPTGLPFDPNIFDLYKPWLGLTSDSDEAQYRLSVARGEEVFNTTKINITGVAGLNDVLNLPSIAGFCGTCHEVISSCSAASSRAQSSSLTAMATGARPTACGTPTSACASWKAPTSIRSPRIAAPASR